MVGHYRSIYQYITPHRWYTIVRNTTKCFLFDRADGYFLKSVESWLRVSFKVFFLPPYDDIPDSCLELRAISKYKYKYKY